MDAGAVVTDGGADIRLERRAERQVPPDAETQCADFSSRDLRMFRQPVQTGPAPAGDAPDDLPLVRGATPPILRAGLGRRRRFKRRDLGALLEPGQHST